MLDARQDGPPDGIVTSQLIGDHHAWHVREILEQVTEEFPRGGCVLPTLHEDIQNIPVLIDGPLQGVSLPVDLDRDLIEVALIASAWSAVAQCVRVGLAELAAPLAHRLV
jgi:hypothetical protein